jgi:uncharacterized DUF497 family protein
VDFELDPKKDEANRGRHGVSLDLARELDGNAMQVTLDDASEPNEERWIGIAPKADRLGLYRPGRRHDAHHQSAYRDQYRDSTL